MPCTGVARTVDGVPLTGGCLISVGTCAILEWGCLTRRGSVYEEYAGCPAKPRPRQQKDSKYPFFSVFGHNNGVINTTSANKSKDVEISDTGGWLVRRSLRPSDRVCLKREGGPLRGIHNTTRRCGVGVILFPRISKESADRQGDEEEGL